MSDAAIVIHNAMQSIDRNTLPHDMQSRIDRHGENLCGLASALLAGGQDLAQVESIITNVLDSFMDEMRRVLGNLVDQNHAQ